MSSAHKGNTLTVLLFTAEYARSTGMADTARLVTGTPDRFFALKMAGA
jgi:hypothetical protein